MERIQTDTRDVNEARSGRSQGREHEAKAEAKIALIFFSQLLHFENEIIG